MKIGDVDLSVERVNYSGGAPRLRFVTAESGKLYAVCTDYEPLRITVSFLLRESETSKISTLREYYENAKKVDVTVDTVAKTCVISSLRYEDTGELIKGSLELVEIDEVIKNDST